MNSSEVPDSDRPENEPEIIPEILAIPEMAEAAKIVELLKLEEGDRKTINDALAFLENPTEEPEETRRHLKAFGYVLAYEFPGTKDQPRLLSRINHRLYLLISQQRIKLIEEELKNEEPDIEKISVLFNDAHSSTGALVTSYNDNVLRDRVLELLMQLERNVSSPEVQLLVKQVQSR